MHRLLVFICVFAIAVICTSFATEEAYADPLSVYTADTSQETSAYFSLYFGHNVAHSDFIAANCALISMIENETGAGVPVSAWSDYSGQEPSDSNPDYQGLRRYINVQASGLKPATGYTLVVSQGIRSSGGHVYDALSYPFLTAGTKPEPPPPDNPPPPPPPDDPPGDGGGGAGGNDEQGGDASGGTEEQGGDASGGTEEQGGDASGGTSDGSTINGGGVDLRQLEADVNQSQTDTMSPSDTSRAAVELGGTMSPSDTSRAAGEGGGTIYILGEPGLVPGSNSKEVLEKKSIEPPHITLAMVVGLAITMALIILVAMIKRMIMWRRDLEA